MRRRKWFILAAVMLVVGAGYVVNLFSSHSDAGSLTVSELKSQAESIYAQQSRVEGRVVPGSVDWDGETQTIRFVLTDDKEGLRVVYKGIVPDNFKPGDYLEVQGKYRSDGVFEASNFGGGNSFCSSCH